MRQIELSPKEKEVALLVAKGYKDVEISRHLYISRRRVGELIASIKEKWGVRSRVEIGVMTYCLGWLRLSLEEDVGIREVREEELGTIDGGFFKNGIEYKILFQSAYASPALWKKQRGIGEGSVIRMVWGE